MLLPARGALSRGYRAVLAQDLEKTAEVVALRAELKATAAREAEAIASAQRAKEAADAQVAHLEKELAAAAAAAATAAVSAAATATAATGNGKPPLAVPGRRRSGTLRGSRLTEGGQSEHYSDDHEPDSEAGEGASMGRAGAQAGAPVAAGAAPGGGADGADGAGAREVLDARHMEPQPTTPASPARVPFPEQHAESAVARLASLQGATPMDLEPTPVLVSGTSPMPAIASLIEGQQPTLVPAASATAVPQPQHQQQVAAGPLKKQWPSRRSTADCRESRQIVGATKGEAES